MDKAPDAFRTISEVAEDLDVPQHVLRFWETRFAQIKPMKRGGGRRFYRPADVDLLRGIKHLLYGEGYTIKGVQRILREDGLKAVQLAWQDVPLDEDGHSDEVGTDDAVQPTPQPVFKPPFVAKDNDAAHKEGRPVDLKKALTPILDDLQACRTVLISVEAAIDQS